jgi:hypothetical protein
VEVVLIQQEQLILVVAVADQALAVKELLLYDTNINKNFNE